MTEAKRGWHGIARGVGVTAAILGLAPGLPLHLTVLGALYSALATRPIALALASTAATGWLASGFVPTTFEDVGGNPRNTGGLMALLAVLALVSGRSLRGRPLGRWSEQLPIVASTAAMLHAWFALATTTGMGASAMDAHLAVRQAPSTFLAAVSTAVLLALAPGRGRWLALPCLAIAAAALHLGSPHFLEQRATDPLRIPDDRPPVEQRAVEVAGRMVPLEAWSRLLRLAPDGSAWALNNAGRWDDLDDAVAPDAMVAFKLAHPGGRPGVILARDLAFVADGGLLVLHGGAPGGALALSARSIAAPQTDEATLALPPLRGASLEVAGDRWRVTSRDPSGAMIHHTGTLAGIRDGETRSAPAQPAHASARTRVGPTAAALSEPAPSGTTAARLPDLEHTRMDVRLLRSPTGHGGSLLLADDGLSTSIWSVAPETAALAPVCRLPARIHTATVGPDGTVAAFTKRKRLLLLAVEAASCRVRELRSREVLPGAWIYDLALTEHAIGALAAARGDRPTLLILERPAANRPDRVP